MPEITYVEHNGTEHTVEVSKGASLMDGAVRNMVPGIEGDCSGMCACATCHIYVPKEWQAHCPEIHELESSMLDFAFDVKDESRLACQIEVTDDLEGMRVLMPERQY